MFYITKSNALRIIKKINFRDLPDNLQNCGEVYKRAIYFLSKYELKYLLYLKTLFKDPEKLFIEIYKPIINKDTYQYVFESTKKPSYHKDKDCKMLNANFQNFEIPFEIKARVRERALSEGKTENQIDELEKHQVKLFRDWFMLNYHLIDSNPEEFLKKLDIRWNIKRKIEEVVYSNSGFKDIENLNLAELEIEVDKILSEAEWYFLNNVDKQELILRFQELIFLTSKSSAIKNNTTGLPFEDLQQFLNEFSFRFKKPIIELLIQYYRIKYNPELSFEGQLLNRLNFRPCSQCTDIDDSSNDFPLDENSILPF